MAAEVVKVFTEGRSVLYVTGRTGSGWLAENLLEAQVYKNGEAGEHAARLNQEFSLLGLSFLAVDLSQVAGDNSQSHC